MGGGPTRQDVTPLVADRLRRSVPARHQGRDGAGPTRGSAPAPDLAHGSQDHDRLGDPDEQGIRGHRGLLAVWSEAVTSGHSRSSAVYDSLHGGVRRRLFAGSARSDRYAFADPVRPYLPGTTGYRPSSAA